MKYFKFVKKVNEQWAITLLPLSLGIVQEYPKSNYYSEWVFGLRMSAFKAGAREWPFLRRHIIGKIWIINRAIVSSWPEEPKPTEAQLIQMQIEALENQISYLESEIKVRDAKDAMTEMQRLWASRELSAFRELILEAVFSPVGGKFYQYRSTEDLLNEIKRLREIQPKNSVPIQINGVLSGGAISIREGASESEIIQSALSNTNVYYLLDGRKPSKIIIIPNRLVNIIIGDEE